MTSKEARQKRDEAHNEYRSAQAALQSIINAEVQEAKTQIILRHEDDQRRVNELQRRWRDAWALMEETSENEALAGQGAKWPLGTRLKKVERAGSFNEKTIYGIYEAITRKSQHVETLAMKASPGDFVVRLINQDGTISKRYDTNMYHWSVA